MRVTLNELQSTMLKAARGAGLALGLGEDLSRACVWLAGFGLNPAPSALAALNALHADTANYSEESGKITLRGAQALLIGPSAGDFLIAGASRLILPHVDSPLLILGYLGARGGGLWRVNEARTDGAQLLAPEDLAPMQKPGRVEAAFAAGHKLTSGARAQAAGVEIEKSCWRGLNRLAARTYVPASMASRTSGAGAGLVDKD